MGGKFKTTAKLKSGKSGYLCIKSKRITNNFMLDGRIEISNNRAENAIRPYVTWRKNWLFADTTRGAKASAIVYSIIETAKANQLNPYMYRKRQRNPHIVYRLCS